MKDLHYFKFVSYSDGSGYCHGLRIKCMTIERAEHLRKCGIIYELMW